MTGGSLPDVIEGEKSHSKKALRNIGYLTTRIYELYMSRRTSC